MLESLSNFDFSKALYDPYIKIYEYDGFFYFQPSSNMEKLGLGCWYEPTIKISADAIDIEVFLEKIKEAFSHCSVSTPDDECREIYKRTIKKYPILKKKTFFLQCYSCSVEYSPTEDKLYVKPWCGVKNGFDGVPNFEQHSIWADANDTGALWDAYEQCKGIIDSECR
jgi:hypothetical protein